MLNRCLDRAKALAGKSAADAQASSDLPSQGAQALPDFVKPVACALGARLAASAVAQLAEPKSAEAALEMAYDLVPLPVKLALPKKAFIEFGLRHREPLLQELKRLQTSLPSPA